MKLKHGTVTTRPGLLVALILTNVNVGIPSEHITTPPDNQEQPPSPPINGLDYDQQQSQVSVQQASRTTAADNAQTIFDLYGSVLYMEVDPLSHPIPDPDETIEEDDDYEINDNDEEEIDEDDEEEFDDQDKYYQDLADDYEILLRRNGHVQLR
ncbi:hypothetical protein LZQ00_06000 [Sphingobacterium sp. SRCM116780]|uniref:hypothetical protein n=1 Tax=Sphingobacterium sp. SRCM116780 TaxID=2907623 RepID=UPI001F1ADE39|nr:hypothetical protein [Sphingobacterium sp. SRCM116780]UIR57368.1 hypothetical protein LZQ00_06000 [Sphingobacterium sp. SRCM116780]